MLSGGPHHKIWKGRQDESQCAVVELWQADRLVTAKRFFNATIRLLFERQVGEHVLCMLRQGIHANLFQCACSVSDFFDNCEANACGGFLGNVFP